MKESFRRAQKFSIRFLAVAHRKVLDYSHERIYHRVVFIVGEFIAKVRWARLARQEWQKSQGQLSIW